MRQDCDNCEEGPADECGEVSCSLHPNSEIKCYWTPKESEDAPPCPVCFSKECNGECMGDGLMGG